MQILATLGRERSAVAAWKIKEWPIKHPIDDKHCLSKRNMGRFEREIHIGVIEDSASEWKSGCYLNTLVGKPSRNQISFNQILLKSPSCWSQISIHFGSRWSRVKLLFSPSLEKIWRDRSMDGRQCENLLIKVKWKGLYRESTRVWGNFKDGSPLWKEEEIRGKLGFCSLAAEGASLKRERNDFLEVGERFGGSP